MFLSIEDTFRSNIILIIIAVILMVLATVFYLLMIIPSQTKIYDKVLNPTHDSKEPPRKDLKNKTKKAKKVKRSFKEKIALLLEKKGIATKLKKMYIQAGHKEKNAEDFVISTIKFFMLGLALGITLLLAFNNFYIPIVVILIFTFIPFIDLKSSVSERKKAFLKEFPYFLQTLSFVLKNGANIAIAFEEVTNKQNDGVLKSVMKDVLTLVKVESGNYGKAFAIIPEQIDTEETKEFVNIVEDQLQKGTSISEVFQKQSDIMNERFQVKQAKLIASSSTRIFVPILIIMFSIALLFISF